MPKSNHDDTHLDACCEPLTPVSVCGPTKVDAVSPQGKSFRIGGLVEQAAKAQKTVQH